MPYHRLGDSSNTKVLCVTSTKYIWFCSSVDGWQGWVGSTQKLVPQDSFPKAFFVWKLSIACLAASAVLQAGRTYRAVIITCRSAANRPCLPSMRSITSFLKKIQPWNNCDIRRAFCSEGMISFHFSFFFFPGLALSSLISTVNYFSKCRTIIITGNQALFCIVHILPVIAYMAVLLMACEAQQKPNYPSVPTPSLKYWQEERYLWINSAHTT